MKKDISKHDNKETNDEEINNKEEEINNKEEERFEAARRRSILRIVAGGYLIYLAYSGLTEMLGEIDSSAPWYFYLIYGAFAIIGIILVVNSIYLQIKNKK